MYIRLQSSPQLPPPSSGKMLDYLPFIQPIVASQWPLSPPPSSTWSPAGRGTTTRTWTSSPTETRALLPSSQVKTENLNLHKLNLEIIVKVYRKPTTHYWCWSLITQGPNRQSTTPTSCTPSTTRSTHSCIRPRPRNNQSSVLFFFYIFCYLTHFFAILFDIWNIFCFLFF